ncbi:MAG: hypothetical protein ACI85U_001971, partial [Candidatus Promineifilaceae bacterium]
MKMTSKVLLQTYLIIAGALFFVLGRLSFFNTPVYGVVIILFGIATLLWLAALWKQGLQNLQTHFDWGLLSMLLVLVLSCLFSIDPSRSWRAIWGWLAAIISFYMFVTLLRTNFTLTSMTSVLFGFLSLFVLLGIIEIYASLPIYWQQWQLTGQWPSIRRL